MKISQGSTSINTHAVSVQLQLKPTTQISSENLGAAVIISQFKQLIELSPYHLY